MKTKTTFFSFLPFVFFLTTSAAPNYPHTENTIDCACEIYIPNVFSPNGDSKNDVFKAIPGTSCSLTQFSLKVFDRFGALVFESTAADTGWDGSFKGQNAPQATYVYVVQYELADDSKKLPKVASGEVSLIR